MKLLLHFLPMLWALTIVVGRPAIEVSTKWHGDRVAMQKHIVAHIDAYSSQLRIICEGLRAAQVTTSGEQKSVIVSSLQSLDAIMQRRDADSASGLLPLVNLLHANNTDESQRILPPIDNASAQSTLNYLIDGIYTARIIGTADAVDETDLEAMLRFYAGNPAQSSEGSWQMNNTMLFVFGDRVLHTLAKSVPDRIDAFYEAVKDARKSAQSGPGVDEEAIPDAERPTSEQLRTYEVSFTRLELLVATGTVPKSDTSSLADLPQASSRTPAAPTVLSAPEVHEVKPTEFRQSEQSTLSLAWKFIFVSIVALLCLGWLQINKRK